MPPSTRQERTAGRGRTTSGTFSEILWDPPVHRPVACGRWAQPIRPSTRAPPASARSPPYTSVELFPSSCGSARPPPRVLLRRRPSRASRAAAAAACQPASIAEIMAVRGDLGRCDRLLDEMRSEWSGFCSADHVVSSSGSRGADLPVGGLPPRRTGSSTWRRPATLCRRRQLEEAARSVRLGGWVLSESRSALPGRSARLVAVARRSL